MEADFAELFKLARQASERAYSPYSRVKVGACVVDHNGRMYTGCNVENMSYGLTQCAERNALASAINAGMQPGQARSLLIHATGFKVLAPCGACRQVMSELMAPDASVISCVSESDFKRWTVGDLLPDPFILE